MAVGGMDITQRVLAAVEAAAAAAQAAAQAAQSAQALRPGPDEKTWWKLLPKPPNFDHSSHETEIAGWEEWSWSFEQYMSSIDTKFNDDIQEMRKEFPRLWTQWISPTVRDSATVFFTACYPLFFVNDLFWLCVKFQVQMVWRLTANWCSRMSRFQ